MSRADQRDETREAFRSFVERLGTHPDRAQLIDKLERDHEADGEGWCRHPLHALAAHPEHHPCTTTQLVAAIRQAGNGGLPT